MCVRRDYPDLHKTKTMFLLDYNSWQQFICTHTWGQTHFHIHLKAVWGRRNQNVTVAETGIVGAHGMLTQPIRGTHLFLPTLLRFKKTDVASWGLFLCKNSKPLIEIFVLGGRSMQMACVVSEGELWEAEVAQ